MVSAELLQPLVPEHESVAVPPQRLDPVPSLVHEQEETAIGGITAEVAADDSRQAIEALPHVDGARIKIDRGRRGDAQHGCGSAAIARIATRTRSARPIAKLGHRRA